MSRETKNILGKPEFEQNCDAFVNEVNTLISQSYKSIQIQATNNTMLPFNEKENTEFMKKVLEHTKEADKNLESFDRFLRHKDIESANANYADVDIWIWKDYDSQKVIKETIFALNDIIRSADRHSGELLTSLTELISDSDKEDDNLPEMSLSELEQLGNLLREVSGQPEDPSINRYNKGRLMNVHLNFLFKNRRKINKENINSILSALAKKNK